MFKFSVILVDMGGVLFDHERALRETTKKLKIPYKRFKEEIDDIYVRRETDGTAIDEFWNFLLNKVGSVVKVQEYKKVYNKSHTRNRQLFTLLKKLKESGVKLGLSTNNIKNHVNDLDKIFDFLKFFDWVFDSSEMGVRKPEEDYYRKIWKITGVPKSQCLFIDDTKKHIDGAKKFGFKTFHFSDFEKSNEALMKYLKRMYSKTR